MKAILQDLRYTARTLWTKPGVTLLAFLSISVQPCFPGYGQNPPSSDSTATALSTKVDALMAIWFKADSPGAALIVVKDGQVEHRKGYGLRTANLPG